MTSKYNCIIRSEINTNELFQNIEDQSFGNVEILYEVNDDFLTQNTECSDNGDCSGSEIDPIEVDDEWLSQNSKYSDNVDCSGSEIEPIEVDDEWLSQNSKYSDNVDCSGSEIEPIEVDDEWLSQNSKYSDNVDCSGSEIEPIEVDDEWLSQNSKYSDNGDCSGSGIEPIEEDDEWSNQNLECSDNVDCYDSVGSLEGVDLGDGNTEDSASGNKKNQINEGSESDFSVHVESIGRIAELKKSLTETNDNSTLNKKGGTRKRKSFKLSVKERFALRKELLKEMHPVRSACKHVGCNIISSERRLQINSEFWTMNYSERYINGMNTINRLKVKQRRKNTSAVKDNTFKYFLKNDEGGMTSVCKIFYLTTLGFSKSNDSFIKTAVGKTKYKIPLPRCIDRSKNLKQLNRDNYETIITHINSHKPNISHHRREHAPKKKYLPETLSITSMYKDFQDQHSNVECSYYLYRRIVSNQLNISFTKLGHEKCETCEEYAIHKKCHPMCTTCDLCIEYEFHWTKYTESRSLYDIQRKLNTETKAYYAGDMEKVVMLPRIEMFKQAIFTTRLSTYNDTFAPLGGVQNNPSTSKPVAILWHEAISGRCKEDIISAFYKFFLLKREVEESVIWLDNCSSQNKNWALFSFLVYIINSNLITTHQIQFNYFEPGHTFMAADSFHYQVELSMKAMEKVYNFDDFQIAVSQANSGNVIVLPMRSNDFMQWPDCSSRTKKKTGEYYMHEIVQVTATRGSYDLKFKKSFTSSDEFVLNFLQEKYRKEGIPCPKENTNDCGIPLERKKNILKLCGIMEPDKIKFYQDLPVTEPVISKKAVKAKAVEVVQRKSIGRQPKKVTGSKKKLAEAESGTSKIASKVIKPVMAIDFRSVQKQTTTKKVTRIRSNESVQRKSTSRKTSAEAKTATSNIVAKSIKPVKAIDCKSVQDQATTKKVTRTRSNKNAQYKSTSEQNIAEAKTPSSNDDVSEAINPVKAIDCKSVQEQVTTKKFTRTKSKESVKRKSTSQSAVIDGISVLGQDENAKTAEPKPNVRRTTRRINANVHGTNSKSNTSSEIDNVLNNQEKLGLKGLQSSRWIC